MLINGDVWDKLSPQHKEIIKSAAMEAFIRWYAKWQRQNADALKEFGEKHNVHVLKTPNEILQEFLKASHRQYASIVVPAKRFLFPPHDFAANHYWPERKTTAAVPRAAPAAAPAKK